MRRQAWAVFWAVFFRDPWCRPSCWRRCHWRRRCGRPLRMLPPRRPNLPHPKQLRSARTWRPRPMPNPTLQPMPWWRMPATRRHPLPGLWTSPQVRNSRAQNPKRRRCFRVPNPNQVRQKLPPPHRRPSKPHPFWPKSPRVPLLPARPTRRLLRSRRIRPLVWHRCLQPRHPPNPRQVPPQRRFRRPTV
jgi:hypothetical protein